MTVRTRRICTLLLGACLLIGLGYWQVSGSVPRQVSVTVNPEISPSPDSPPSDSVENSDSETGLVLPEKPTSPDNLTPEQIQQIVVGIWQSEYYGTRYLTVRSDGTATIYFQASTLASMLVGRRLRIEYDWHYDAQAKQVVFNVVGGAPKSGLDYVMKTWGKQQRQDVLTVWPQELHLRDLDGVTEHRWVHLKTIPQDVTKLFSQL